MTMMLMVMMMMMMMTTVFMIHDRDDGADAATVITRLVHLSFFLLLP